MTADGVLRIVCMRLCREPIRVLTTLPPPTPPPPHPHTHTHTLHPTHSSKTMLQSCLDLFYMSYICIPFSAVHRPVLHVIQYAYLFFSHTPTCATRHTYAYLFQPEAEVKDGVAGVCERCVRCSYPQVFTVQQHVQMSVCVHPHPDTTARFDLT